MISNLIFFSPFVNYNPSLSPLSFHPLIRHRPTENKLKLLPSLQLTSTRATLDNSRPCLSQMMDGKSISLSANTAGPVIPCAVTVVCLTFIPPLALLLQWLLAPLSATQISLSRRTSSLPGIATSLAQISLTLVNKILLVMSVHDLVSWS